MPAIVTCPVRGFTVALGLTSIVKVPLPAPVLAAEVNHGTALLTPQPHPASVVTFTVIGVPVAGAEPLVGVTSYVQPAAEIFVMKPPVWLSQVMPTQGAAPLKPPTTGKSLESRRSRDVGVARRVERDAVGSVEAAGAHRVARAADTTSRPARFPWHSVL